MAPHWEPVALLFFVLAFFVLEAKLNCHDLAVEECAFSVSDSGSRCVLEKYTAPGGNKIYECQTSSVLGEKIEAWIETEECVQACGLERMWVGMSTDGLLQKEFTNKICSPACQNNCHNLVDLFTKLAAGEGIQLPHVCNHLQRSSSRKLIGLDATAFDKISSATLAAINSLKAAEAPTAILINLEASAPSV